ARQAGLEIEFLITDEVFPHPNTYKVRARGGERQFTALFVSCGGGMIWLRELNGIPLDINGGYYETLFLLGLAGAEESFQALQELSALFPFYEDICLAGNGELGYIINIKSARPLNLAAFCLGQKDVAGCISLQAVRVADIISLPAVLPVQSYKHYSGLFNTAAAIEEIAQAENISLAQVALLYEARRGHITQDEVYALMRRLLQVMRQSLAKAKECPEYQDRILPPQAYLLATAPQFPNPVLNEAILNITLLMEAKSAMLPIVASPTAGSCAALPGTILGAAKILGKEEKAVTEALLAAGMIGILIAEHATFAAEIGGCQAECGAASGMAAAGLVQLMGGSVSQALNGAALALQNVFGLVCDPVASRVEAPCLGKNIMAGANALAMAQIALAGFDALIPLDETIAALHEVGQKIDSTLRCTCQGGLSLTPTAQKIAKRLNMFNS
ncbi:MAG: L-serine ammonia-lyase, iron-sulfur-dependent, subunit alpha, partial [Firmicutes bacterium]|nr:L-serine ammonia-lyase, iron-sulfur-dependent, subunit alpha [Bacillota bacterium]